MLSYAANAVRYWPPESIRRNFEEDCQRRGNDPDLELAKCIGEEISAEQFWESVKRNLQAGKIRMIFLADVIPDELASIVEFLNEQMDPAEVLAVELRRFRTGNTEALSPRLVGRTEEAKHRKGTSVRPKRKWNAESFFQVLSAKCVEQTDAARTLLEWANANASRIWWGEGATNGSFIPLIVHGDDQHQLFGVYNGGENGQACIEIHFQYLARHKPFSDIELRRELLNRLNNVPGISISEGRIEGRPSVPLSTLQDRAVRTQFIQVLDWVAQQIRNCPPNE